MTKTELIISWIVRIIAAIILLQTLYYKFSGAEESIYIFSTIGIEPWGRIGIGVMELITAILLLTLRWNWLGAIIGIGLMAGALFFHLIKLGIVVKNDGGQLFAYAIIVLVCCVVTLYLHRTQLFTFLNKLKIL